MMAGAAFAAVGAAGLTSAGILRAQQQRLRAQLDAERARHRAELEEARTCPITALPQRAAWRPRAMALLAAGGVEIGFIDLDGFKAINDAHGHFAGDWVLAATAQRLVALRPGASVVGSAGGDEFVVVAPERTMSWIAVDIGLRQPITLDNGCEVAVGASIGVAGGRGSDLGELLRQADAAMYRAKERGGGIQVSAPSSIPEQVLTAREFDVATLIAQGCTNKEISRRLQLELATVKWNVRRIRAKLGVTGDRDDITTSCLHQTTRRDQPA